MSQNPKLLGILNLTPDSFTNDGVFLNPKQAVHKAQRLIDKGADYVDVGAESTKPGASYISLNEELRRLVPTLFALYDENIPFSVDTRKPMVVEKIRVFSPAFINCTFLTPKMMEVVGNYYLPLVIMHTRGDPQNMNSLAKYDDVVSEVKSYFEEKIKIAQRYGVKKIILDPGLGFAKKKEDSYALLNNLESFHSLGFPLLIGASRKGFVGKSLEGTLNAHRIAIQKGAEYLRVHDVYEHDHLLRTMFRR